MRSGTGATSLPPIEVGGHNIGPDVLASIKQASQKTGVSFEFLLAQASRESNFQPEAKSKRSTAAGLFQFTESTWLEMMQRHGAKYGHGTLVSHIARDRDGNYDVADEGVRRSILDLRRDPGLSALMAAEFAKSNRAILEREIHRKASTADLYLAHFIGPGAAIKFLKAKESDGDQAAATVLPRPAKANPDIFFQGNSSRSVASVYAKIQGMIDRPMRTFADGELRETAAQMAALKDQARPGVDWQAKAVLAGAPAAPSPALPSRAAVARAFAQTLAKAAETPMAPMAPVVGLDLPPDPRLDPNFPSDWQAQVAVPSEPSSEWKAKVSVASPLADLIDRAGTDKGGHRVSQPLPPPLPAPAPAPGAAARTSDAGENAAEFYRNVQRLLFGRST